MPILPNAKKALRQNEKRRKHNLRYKNRIKKLYKRINALAKEGKVEDAQQLLPTYFKAVDKAAKRNIIHKNTAARKKSAVSRILASENSK